MFIYSIHKDFYVHIYRYIDYLCWYFLLSTHVINYDIYILQKSFMFVYNHNLAKTVHDSKIFIIVLLKCSYRIKQFPIQFGTEYIFYGICIMFYSFKLL